MGAGVSAVGDLSARRSIKRTLVPEEISMYDHSPTFLSLARELRDLIYDTLLFAAVAESPPSIPPHLADVDNNHFLWSKDPWKWLLDPGSGSCYGLMYCCKQICTELIQSIERHGGLTFELELTLRGIPSYPHIDSEERRMVREEVWLTPIVFPLCLPFQPFKNPSLLLNQTATTCKRLHVSIKVESELNFRWQGNGGLSWVTRSLFTMLARFLLCGPLGLFNRNLETGVEWNIDSLFVDITGIGATFEDALEDRRCTVPKSVIENTRGCLSEWLDILCRSGALSGRIRTVHLALDSEIKQEWSIEEGKSLHPAVKKDWRDYGWITCKRDIRRSIPLPVIASENMISETIPEHRKKSMKSCCTLQ